MFRYMQIIALATMLQRAVGIVSASPERLAPRRLSPLVEVDLAGDFAGYVERLWANDIHVHDLHIGNPAPNECPAGPKIWLFLSGDYRTFHSVQRAIRSSLEDSVGQCYHVVLAVPHVFGPPSKWEGGWTPDALAKITPFSNDTPGVIAQVQQDRDQVWGEHLSSVVVEKTGALAKYTGGWGTGTFQMMYAHVSWLVARVAVEQSDVAVDPHSILIQSRPDIGFGQSFEAEPLLAYFRATDGARRYRWSQVVAQDLIAISSFVTFEANVAYPIDVLQHRKMEPSTAGSIIALAALLARNLWSQPFSGLDLKICLDGVTQPVDDCQRSVTEVILVLSALQNSCVCRVRDQGTCYSQTQCFWYTEYQQITGGSSRTCTEPHMCVIGGVAQLQKINLLHDVIIAYDYNVSQAVGVRGEEMQPVCTEFQNVCVKISKKPFELGR